MFLSQEARSVVATFRYSNFVRMAQVGIMQPQYFTGILHNYYRMCRPQGSASKSYVLRRSSVTFEGDFVNSSRYNAKLSSVSEHVTTTLGLKSPSVHTVEITLFCLPRMNKRKTPDILHVSECFFSRDIEIRTIRSSTNLVPSRALSTGTKQKQVTLIKGVPATKDKKIQSSKNPKGEAERTKSEGKQSKAKQLRKVFKEYGAVGVSFHVGISLISLGIFYLALSSGINMAAVLCKLGFSESVVQSKMAAGTSTFVLAYALHKVLAPLRISITLVSVPLVVRYLRKTGLFKPPSS